MKKTILAAGAAILALGSVAYAAAPGGDGADRPDRNADISIADAKAKMAERFDKMDVNGDGKLDQADRAAKVAEHFAKLDTNSDGSLSLEEFSTRPERPERGERPGGDRMARGDGERGPGMHEGHRGKRGHGMRGERGGMGMARMADANNDGVVTRAEFEAAAVKRLSAMDSNGDGTVTAEERKAARETMREMRKQKMEDSADS